MLGLSALAAASSRPKKKKANASRETAMLLAKSTPVVAMRMRRIRQ